MAWIAQFTQKLNLMPKQAAEGRINSCSVAALLCLLKQNIKLRIEA